MNNQLAATGSWKHYTKQKKCPCGVGSTVSSTIRVRAFIAKVFKKYNIKTVSDAPCGQYDLWTHLVDWQDVMYTGYDINEELIEHNKERYPDIQFFRFDIVKEILPRTDLIICRDCLFHLSDAFIAKALENFKESGSTYLMTPTYNWVDQNTDLNRKELAQEYGYRPINLVLPPYDMGPYMDSTFEPSCKKRTVGLWRLN